MRPSKYHNDRLIDVERSGLRAALGQHSRDHAHALGVVVHAGSRCDCKHLYAPALDRVAEQLFGKEYSLIATGFLLQAVHAVDRERVVVRLHKCKLTPVVGAAAPELVLDDKREGAVVRGARTIRYLVKHLAPEDWLPHTILGRLLVHPDRFHAFSEQQRIRRKAVDAEAYRVRDFHIADAEAKPAL